jgi:hypothetical protein
MLCCRGDTVSKVTSARRKIDLRIVDHNGDMEFSHSEFARVATPAKLTKDRSKCLRTNQSVLNNYLKNYISHEAVSNSLVLGLQGAGKDHWHL